MKHVGTLGLQKTFEKVFFLKLGNKLLISLLTVDLHFTIIRMNSKLSSISRCYVGLSMER